MLRACVCLWAGEDLERPACAQTLPLRCPLRPRAGPRALGVFSAQRTGAVDSHPSLLRTTLPLGEPATGPGLRLPTRFPSSVPGDGAVSLGQLAGAGVPLAGLPSRRPLLIAAAGRTLPRGA